MSILAYLNLRREPLRMPDAEKTPNHCGIQWQGPVLTGKQSVNQAMNKEETRATTDNR